jgi:electron transport complex protein RnfG
MKKKQDNKGRFRKTVSYQAILLGLSTLIATTLLSFGNLATKDAIAMRLEEDLKASISQVVAEDLYDNDLLQGALIVKDASGDEVTVYRAQLNGEITGVVFEVRENGYSGTIRSIMAVATDGTILGVRILAHSETPGLGDKIEINKNDWVLGFNGRSLDDPGRSAWTVRKDGGEFDQFTGATITPRAVVKSIRQGLEFFEQQRELLLVPVVGAEGDASDED